MIFFECDNTDNGFKMMKFFQWLTNESKIKYKVLVKVDTDTFFRSEIMEENLRSLPEDSAPLYMGHRNHHKDPDATYCGRHWANYWYMVGATWTVSREIVQWLANSPDLPDDLRWCRQVSLAVYVFRL